MHPDVESLAIRHRVVDRGDDVADVSVAGAVERLEHDQVGTGRDAAPAAVRVHARARNDPGDVRAVPVVVVRNGLMGRRSRPSARPGRVPRSSCDGETPESIIATPTPGAVHAEVLPQPARADRAIRRRNRSLPATGLSRLTVRTPASAPQLRERAVGDDGDVPRRAERPKRTDLPGVGSSTRRHQPGWCGR